MNKENVWKEKIIIAPSLITLDLCNLESQVKELEKAGIEVLHVDILDGYFSPSMPLGLDTVRQLRKKTDMLFDVHLMAKENDYFVNELLDIGVDQLTFHAETETHIDNRINQIHKSGVRAGIALKPATTLHTLDYVIEKCDNILLMLINPGYASDKSEKQISYGREKIEGLKEIITKKNLPTTIEIDGRISQDNIKEYGKNLVNIFVGGSTCIKKDNISNSVKELMEIKKQLG